MLLRRLRERRGPPDQRHRRVWSASAAAAGAAADSASTRLPDAPHQTAQHQPGRGTRLFVLHLDLTGPSVLHAERTREKMFIVFVLLLQRIVSAQSLSEDDIE